MQNTKDKQRIIKFRVWDNFNTRMYFPNVRGLYEIMGVSVWIGSNFFLLQSDRFNTAQFTGLLDKNGKEIFEKDLVKFGGKFKTVGIVSFGEYSNELNGSYGNGWFIDCDGSHYPIDQSNLEIIGNVFENPSLAVQKMDTLRLT